MFGQLVPCGGGAPIPLPKPRLTVGRTVGNDVVLPFKTVSSRHCELELRNDGWYIRDLGSHNGIRINGVRCQDGVVPPGAIVTIAQHRYHFEYAAPASRGRSDSASPPVRTSLPPRPSQTLSNLGELIPCGGGEPIRLSKRQLVIGRSPACDITLPFSTISSRHCELEFKEGFWHIRDLGSRNGLRVNGERYTSKYLKPGEIVSVATHRFEIAYTPQADEPPPDENPFALSLLEKAGLARRDAAGQVPEFRSKPDPDEQRKRWVIDERNLDK